MNAVVHLFEQRGLGKAPFECVSYVDVGSVRAGVTCQYCGTAIRNVYTVRDALRATFVVGCECIRKTGDKGLRKAITEAEREKRRAKAAAKEAARRAEWDAECEAQRQRNGGRTDREVEIDAVAERQAKERAECQAVNQWLIDGIYGMTCREPSGSFLSSVYYDLTHYNHPTKGTELPPRARQILAEIWATRTTGKSKRAKEWQVACEFAEERLGLLEVPA